MIIVIVIVVTVTIISTTLRIFYFICRDFKVSLEQQQKAQISIAIISQPIYSLFNHIATSSDAILLSNFLLCFRFT